MSNEEIAPRYAGMWLVLNIRRNAFRKCINTRSTWNLREAFRDTVVHQNLRHEILRENSRKTT